MWLLEEEVTILLKKMIYVRAKTTTKVGRVGLLQRLVGLCREVVVTKAKHPNKSGEKDNQVTITTSKQPPNNQE